MHYRCYNTKHASWARYGGRGIKVCVRWHRSNPNGLVNFISDMGRRPSGKYSLDRINGDGDYCPVNCRWATRDEQQNNMRNNRRFAIGSQTLTISEWARLAGLSVSTVHNRLKRGCSIEQALSRSRLHHGRALQTF
jgi:hypothetical protein